MNSTQSKWRGGLLYAQYISVVRVELFPEEKTPFPARNQTMVPWSSGLYLRLWNYYMNCRVLALMQLLHYFP